MQPLELKDAGFVVWYRFLDQVPELVGMIKLPEVAELVDNDVVCKVFRDEGDLVVEVEVALF